MIVTYTEQRDPGTKRVTYFTAGTDTPFRWIIFPDERYGVLQCGPSREAVKRFHGTTAMDIHKKITTYLMGLGKVMGGAVRNTGVNMLKGGA